MGNKALENRIKKLKVGIFIIRFTSGLSSRFDTKRFKEQEGKATVIENGAVTGFVEE